MIVRLALKGVPPYTGAGVVLDQLRKANFVFGGNGSGKSTLSRQLAEYTPDTQGPLSLTWSGEGSRRIDVYNEDFKRKAFFEDPSVPGIFTLGTEDVARGERLKALDKELETTRGQIEQLKRRIGTDDEPGLRQEKGEAWNSFQDRAWTWNRLLQEPFKPLLAGKNQKNSFAKHLVERHKQLASAAAAPDYEDLRLRAASVLDSSTGSRAPLAIPAFARLAEARATDVMDRPIVAAADVKFAELVKRLDISDWVKRGREHQIRESKVCVFCQQPAPEDLLQQINALFDETYERDLAEVRAVRDRYAAVVESVRRVARLLLDLPEGAAPTLDREALRIALKHVGIALDANLSAFDNKLGEPGRRLPLTDEAEAYEPVLTLLKHENVRIEEHNALVKNRAAERKRLEEDLWRYLVVTHRDDIAQYRTKVADLDRGVQSLQTKIIPLESRLSSLDNEKRELNKTLGNTQATADAINAKLKSAGFDSFQLQVAAEGGQYGVVRPEGDASGVARTLSEGERTLLSFLHFYYRVSDGALDAASLGEDRVVVIDDPIASVDSDVMFLVAHLVRDLEERVKSPDTAADGHGRVRQLFVLTHNAHFHHAVTHSKGRRVGPAPHQSFWTLAKREGLATCADRHMDKNPVSTTYEMLWDEVREGLKANVPPIGLRNAMRRIVEYYFVQLGTCKNLHEVSNSVPEEHRMAARALTFWLNDGSHSMFGDAQALTTPDEVRRSAHALRELFKANGSEAHWEAMMRVESSEA